MTVAGHTLGLWRLAFYVSAPFSALKQLISVIQMWAACINISLIDLEDRKAARAAKRS